MQDARTVGDLAVLDASILQALSQPLDKSCPLTLLSQSAETTIKYQDALKEYLGPPNGEELRLVKLVWDNIMDAAGPCVHGGVSN